MITKIDVAERQLNTAIRLFFENWDHLSSYALAVASRDVTDDVIQSRSSEIYQRELARVGDPLKVRLSYRKEMCILIEPEFYKDFLKLDRKWQNFLKHADRDPDAEIEPFTTKQVALAILTAIWNYALLTEHWTAEVTTFWCWIGIAEPQLVNLAPGHAMNQAIDMISRGVAGDPYDRDTLQNMYTAMRL